MPGLSAENKLRDVFNPRIITSLADEIKKVWSGFDRKGFLNTILPKLDDLSFGKRSMLIRDALGEFLPKEFPKAMNILLKALPPELSNTDPGVTVWDAFIVWPQTAFVSKYGKDYFDLSMHALYEMTKRLSAEGDLRTFIEIDYDRAMSMVQKWCNDPNPHVRRLVSEGTRPRLPLAGRIKSFQKDPRPVIKLLEKLKDDETEYVRRSVANNINDIAKDNPDIALATLKTWSKDSKPEAQWVVRHAARTLIKQGHPEAIAMLGYSVNPKITLSELAITPKKQKRGGTIEFSFSVRSKAATSQKLVVDSVVYYRKANGKLSPKVFKLRDMILRPKSEVRISKKLVLKNTSGRTIYPGYHEIEIQINGKPYSKHSFVVD
ncbi:DNA alkylation repair protein [bacterium]|nr:DNA alkylation repair protein [bacterium]